MTGLFAPSFVFTKVVFDAFDLETGLRPTQLDFPIMIGKKPTQEASSDCNTPQD